MDRGPLTLDALFSYGVHRYGDAVAVQEPGRSVGYRRLDALADRAAGLLRERGVEPGGVVVFHGERSALAVAAILGISRLGAAFVLAGPETPAARLRTIVADAGASLLLVDLPGDPTTDPAPGVPTACLAEVTEREPEREEPPFPGARPDGLAYILYTSGTTGRPKGVMIEQRSLAGRFHDFDLLYRLREVPPRVLQIARLGFDVFLGDLVKALGSGGTLVLCPPDDVLDPARLHRRLTDERIDYAEVVPAILRNLVDHLEEGDLDLAGLGVLNCGADLFTKEEYERTRRVARAGRLLNTYGVTECTVESTAFEDDGASLAGRDTLPIGRPLASDELLVVDEELRPVAAGEVGQICLGGPCVARGYLGRPELDARAFFERPGRAGAPVRFYKTGDRGRLAADGQLEFLGRLDSQIKVDGHRIEPGEVEAVLERLAPVRRAVVCVPEDEGMLTAFVEPSGATPVVGRELTAALAKALPPYMVPKQVVEVAELPLTGNGKVDRKAVAARRGGGIDLAGVRDVEELRARLWSRGVDAVAVASELLKPTARYGLVAYGPFAPGGGEPPGDLGLLALVAGERDLKRRRPPPFGAGARQGTLRVGGVGVAIELVVGGPETPEPDECFLARLREGWAIAGAEVVEAWRERYLGVAAAAPERGGGA